MSVTSGQTISEEFTTRAFATGSATNADSLPTGTLIVNKVANAAVVTIANTSTGIYTFSVTLPTLAIGDRVQVRITATVGGITDNYDVWQDVKDLAIGALGDVTVNNIAAIVTAIWTDLISSSDFAVVGSVGNLIVPIIIRGNPPSGGGGKTPVSSVTSYCTPTQYFDFCDWRLAAELCSDTQVAMTQAQLIQSTAFTNQLAESSGEFEAATMLGGRYTAVDLQVLLASGQVQAQTLIRGVAKLAEARFIQRRPGYTLNEAHMQIIGEGGMLDKLAAGERVFAFQEALDAGHLHSQVNTAYVIKQRDGAVVQSQRLFGRRADRSDPNRQG